MAPRRTLIALCSLASSAVVAATCFISGRSVAIIGSDETIGTIPQAFATSDSGLEEHETPGEITPGRCEASRRESASNGSSFQLVVLERGTRRPLPGAQVATWADPTGDHNAVRYYGHWIGPDFSAFITSHGVTLTADAQGMVTLHRDGHRLFVAARSNELFGMTEISPDESGQRELEIAPSHDVDVVVRDAQGGPCAGVGVGISACRDPDAFWVDVTDANGRCRIHDFEAIVGEENVQSKDAVTVRLDVAAAPAIEQWVDPTHLPSEPIVLVAPPTGTLRMRLVDGSGHVLAVDGEVQIGIMGTHVPGTVRPFASNTQMRVALHAGRAVAEHMPLHQRLWISADLDGVIDPSNEVDGPSIAGETFDVDLATDESCVLVRGRVVDESGAPLSEIPMRWVDSFDDGRNVVGQDSELLRTTADGHFAWTMRRSSDYDESKPRRTCRLFEDGVRSAHRESALPIPFEVKADVLELGDVTLIPGEPLVRGRVVDKSGRGVRGVALDVVVLVSKAPSRNGVDGFDPRRDDVKECSSCDRIWSSGDGSFAFYGPCLGFRWAVRVHGLRDETSRIVPFECGPQSKPMEIIVQATGRVGGTALVDREWDSDGFRVKFVPDGDEQAEPAWGNWWMDGDHVCFSIEAPAPDRGRVEFCGEDSPAPATFTVRGVDILSGVNSHPQALVGVDLRGKLAQRASHDEGMPAIELEIVDELGRPIPSGIAWVWTKESQPTLVNWVGGRAKIASPDMHCIEVWAPEHCFHVLSQPLESARIVLKPGIELEIALTLPPELKDPAITLTSIIKFMSAGDDPMSPHSFDGDSVIRFDRTGKALVRACASGAYGVEVTLTRRVGPATEDDDGTLETVILQWFQVRNVGGVQTLTFTPDAEELETALKDLGLTKD